MARKEKSVSPEDILYLQAHDYINKALLQGGRDEEYTLLDTMREERFEDEVITGLLFMDDADFDFSCRLFRALDTLLKRIRTQRRKAHPEEPMSAEEAHCDSFGELDALFSKLTGAYASGSPREKTLRAVAQIRIHALREGGEERRRNVAERMKRLGFPPHMILTVTGMHMS
jgi:hypothetical protein